MKRIEMDAMEAQIRAARTLDKISGALTSIVTQLTEQNELLKKLVNKKEKIIPDGRMWYWTKEIPVKKEEEK